MIDIATWAAYSPKRPLVYRTGEGIAAAINHSILWQRGGIPWVNDREIPFGAYLLTLRQLVGTARAVGLRTVEAIRRRCLDAMTNTDCSDCFGSGSDRWSCGTCNGSGIEPDGGICPVTVGGSVFDAALLRRNLEHLPPGKTLVSVLPPDELRALRVQGEGWTLIQLPLEADNAVVYPRLFA